MRPCPRDDLTDAFWMPREWRRVFQNVHGEWAARLNVEAWIETVYRAGARVVTLDVKRYRTTYPTEIGVQEPALRGRDMAREAIEACHSRGMKFIAYLFNSCQDEGAQRQHPEWLMKWHDGTTPLSYFGYGALCYNSPWREFFGGYLRECIARGADGFFFDSNDQFPGTCYCEWCARAFRERYGADLPREVNWDDPLWRRFVRFREDTILDFLRLQRDVARSDGVERPIIVNWWMPFNDWRCGQTDRALRLDGIYAMSESHLSHSEGVTDHFGRFWSPTALRSYLIQRQRAAAGGRVCGGWCKHDRPYGAWSWEAPPCAEVERQLRVHAHTANGAILEVSTVLFGNEQRSIAEIAEREPWLTGAAPLPWVGLVSSATSRNYAVRSSRSDSPEPYRRYRQEELGFFMACLEAHWPCRLLTDQDLDEGRFGDAAVLVLPDVRCLSDAAAEHVRAFVRQGGGLVATGETGTLNELGDPRAVGALADVLGVTVRGHTEFRRPRHENLLGGGYTDDHRQRIGFPRPDTDLGRGLDIRTAPFPGYAPDDTLINDFSDRYRITYLHPLPIVAADPDVEVLSVIDYEAADNPAVVMPPMQEPFRFDYLPGLRWESAPAVTRRRYGAGCVVYTAFPVGRLDQERGDEYIRRFILNVLRTAASRPPDIEGIGPAGVVMTFQDQPTAQRWVVHLLNDIPLQGRPPLFSRQREAVLPAPGLELGVRRPVTRAYLAPERKPLPVREAGGEWRIPLPPLEVYATVAIE